MENSSDLLNEVGHSLDISPSDFRRAKQRYEAVSKWLAAGEYNTGVIRDIYLQGSFKLGTVVRPFKNGQDAEFDIDQVCQLERNNEPPNPKILKEDIGNRLKENDDYQRMLDSEGQRCWTLNYASPDGITGFHLDVLPAINNATDNHDIIGISDYNKVDNKYAWSISNPKGYYQWFKEKNPLHYDFAMRSKKAIFESNRDLYSVVEDVPTQLLRSPLQRAIQILKRHRDVNLDQSKYKPISIIITTLCAHLYGMGDITNTIESFLKYSIAKHKTLLLWGELEYDGILGFANGDWIIQNPACTGSNKNVHENFAEKWNQDLRFSQTFFTWIYQLSRDFDRFRISNSSSDLSLKSHDLSSDKGFPATMRSYFSSAPSQSTFEYTDNLLHLIHLAIEKKAPWDFVESLANRKYKNSSGDSKDIALVNYLQILIHQGKALSREQRTSIERMLLDYRAKPDFVYCCNLLKGTATLPMLRSCITDESNRSGKFSSVLEWPIVRLDRNLHR